MSYKNFNNLDLLLELINTSPEIAFHKLVDYTYELPFFPLVIRHLVQMGFKITKESLPHLRGIIDNTEKTSFAHEFALFGYVFTLDELELFNRTLDKRERTVAHCMAFCGNNFAVGDLLKLGNPCDCDGFTVAHYMAMRGFYFSENDIRLLGNPIGMNGQTLNVLYQDHEKYLTTRDQYKTNAQIKFREKPSFRIDGYDTDRLFLNFGEIFGSDIFHAENSFKLGFRFQGGEWRIGIDKVNIDDVYNSLIQLEKIEELVEKLNSVVIFATDYNFSADIEGFKNLTPKFFYAET